MDDQQLQEEFLQRLLNDKLLLQLEDEDKATCVYLLPKMDNAVKAGFVKQYRGEF